MLSDADSQKRDVVANMMCDPMCDVTQKLTHVNELTLTCRVCGQSTGKGKAQFGGSCEHTGMKWAQFQVSAVVGMSCRECMFKQGRSFARRGKPQIGSAKHTAMDSVQEQRRKKVFVVAGITNI